MPELAELPGVVTIRKPPFRFTRENAREMAARGNAKRWSQPEPEPQPPAITPASREAVADNLDEFATARLARVRAQLVRLDAMMDREADPKRFKELAEASARLSDQEGWLANRPKPGSRRPAPERGERRQARSTGPAYLSSAPSTPTGSVQ